MPRQFSLSRLLSADANGPADRPDHARPVQPEPADVDLLDAYSRAVIGVVDDLHRLLAQLPQDAALDATIIRSGRRATIRLA